MHVFSAPEPFSSDVTESIHFSVLVIVFFKALARKRSYPRFSLPFRPTTRCVGMMPGGLDRPSCPGKREREKAQVAILASRSWEAEPAPPSPPFLLSSSLPGGLPLLNPAVSSSLARTSERLLCYLFVVCAPYAERVRDSEIGGFGSGRDPSPRRAVDIHTSYLNNIGVRYLDYDVIRRG